MWIFFPPSRPPLWGRDPWLRLVMGSHSQQIISTGMEHDELARAGITACADLGCVFLINKLQFFKILNFFPLSVLPLLPLWSTINPQRTEVIYAFV